MADNPNQFEDIDAQETQEWLDALDAIIEAEGPERAHYILEQLIDKARRSGAYLPYTATTAYLNTIPSHMEERLPGDAAMERRIRSLVRWNAMAMVVAANRKPGGVGGHIASYQSAATLYETGFNHFFRGPQAEHGADLIYFQGHSAPGIYARAYLEGRLSDEQIANFRREVGEQGLPSYPHPRVLPGFWQFPTVSMGLGPIQAIYQARFMKYLNDRGIIEAGDRRIWAFLGDGETDEPESLGAISLAGRENLDNLIFVVNCNLQRLDGPVRGNGKIIQELEGTFRGAGWNVIKVIWGSRWDELLAKDTNGILRKRMEEVVDGDYQTYKAKGGAYVREHFFGKYPELADLVANMSDDDIWRLNRGGHDPHKIYAAYATATKVKGQPTVILAKTIKGYGMGEAGEGMNITHQQKKMGDTALRHFRDRFAIPVSDEHLATAALYRPGEESPELKYMKERREALGGYLPSRNREAPALEVPELAAFDGLLKGSGEREMSTTMAMVRILTQLTKDKKIGKYIVPIVPDEARTFGMEGLFRQVGIYSSKGQLYEPEDAAQLMYYKESKSGQILEEGINEAGAMSSWVAAGTAYSSHGVNMIPIYIFYSMFGFQRIGDLAWLAGDIQAKGFLVGGTAGRTTLAGEGLQHNDGHSHLIAATVPSCIGYDPTFAYELAVIVQDGLRRMFVAQENVFYYITAMNENYAHPAMPEGCEAGILKGMYLLREGESGKQRVQLLGSGTILREAIAAAELLKADFGVEADIWSATSFTELRREGLDAERWNRLHPTAKKPRKAYVTECLENRGGPVIAASDYMNAFADQIRAWVPGHYTTLGTDGFGRSDSREQLRAYFEVDRYHITIAALKALADEGSIPSGEVTEAIKKYGIDPERPNPADL
ncbi:pyruvate dehydrogenase (acetyl-transferring), homodimeric type [Endothiovibrio diazotrophicus]